MVAFNFEDRIWTDFERSQSPEQPAFAAQHAANDNPPFDGRLKALLGDKWFQLPEPVRRRFSALLAPGQSRTYKGRILQTRQNRIGYLLAQALRIIGAPLPLEQNNPNTPAIVEVTERPGNTEQLWHRHYSGKRPQIIQSRKSFSGPTGMEEYIGFGIGIALDVTAENQVLLFKSRHYFFRVLGRRLNIPRILNPGHMVASHKDLGDGSFQFGLQITHPWFGTLLHQIIEFTEAGGDDA